MGSSSISPLKSGSRWLRPSIAGCVVEIMDDLTVDKSICVRGFF